MAGKEVLSSRGLTDTTNYYVRGLFPGGKFRWWTGKILVAAVDERAEGIYTW